MCVCVCVRVCTHARVYVQSCPTLCNPLNCSPLGSLVNRIFQARTLEWLPFPPPGDLPEPGLEHESPASLALPSDSLPTEPSLEYGSNQVTGSSHTLGKGLCRVGLTGGRPRMGDMPSILSILLPKTLKKRWQKQQQSHMRTHQTKQRTWGLWNQMTAVRKPPLSLHFCLMYSTNSLRVSPNQGLSCPHLYSGQEGPTHAPGGARAGLVSGRLGHQGHPCNSHLAITSTTFVSGTFQQVTNLLNIMESESTKTDTEGAGFDMRKRLASVIITEKATTEPSVVMNALIRCLQVPEVGPPPPGASLSLATCLHIHPLLSTHLLTVVRAGLGAGAPEDQLGPGVLTIFQSSSVF